MQDNNTPKSKLDQIKLKIRKLLNLADRAGTEAEASNAANRAAELLATYNIDRATLGSGEILPLGTEVIVKWSSNVMPSHLRYLSQACFYLFNIRLVTYTGARTVAWGADKWDTSRYGAFIVASGDPAALEASRQAIALFNMAITRGLAKRKDLIGRSAKASYRLAAACEILDRAKMDKLERDRLARENAPQVYGLVLADNNKLDRYHRERFPQLKSFSGVAITDPYAAAAGRSDGANIGLNRAATIGGRRLLGA